LACALAPFVVYLLAAVTEASAVPGDGPVALQGLLSILALGGPIAAIALGVVVRRDPTVSQGSRNMALAAIILGAITLGFYVLAVLFILLLIVACANACSSATLASVSGAAASSSCASLSTAPRPAGQPRSWRDACAHHPDHPAFRADVFRVAGVRLCVGCATVYPALALASLAVWLWPIPGSVAWTAGLLLASLQGVSAVGWARRRWQKVAVKASFGAGAALLLRAIFDAPWPDEMKSIALAAAGLAALASAQPRLRRIARLSAATPAPA
jgi:hypothetical protein